MSKHTKASEKLTKLAEEAKLVAETTQDQHRRRALRLMALKYKRLAEFSRTHPDGEPPERAK
jgi:ribosomal protein S15P/S13E